jgi:hypothetical protein
MIVQQAGPAATTPTFTDRAAITAATLTPQFVVHRLLYCGASSAGSRNLESGTKISHVVDRSGGEMSLGPAVRPIVRPHMGGGRGHNSGR